MLQEHTSESCAQTQSLFIAFKPRQLILAQTNIIIPNKTTNTMNKDQTLNSDQKSLLLSSVLCYLNTNSFSKPLKRLISAANIQDDSWKACSLNLEGMFKHYLETGSIVNGTKKEEDDHSSEEAVVKKKKKKCDDIGNVAAVAEEVELKTKKKTKKGSDSVEETKKLTEHTTKEQKYKKKNNKDNSEPLESNVDSKEVVKSKDKKKKSESSAKSDGNGEADPAAQEKPKDKKKKNKKQSSDLDVKKADIREAVLSKDKKEGKEDSSSNMLSNGVTEVANKEGVEKEKKESKKRKRSESDDNDMGTPLASGSHEVKGGEFAGNKSRRKDNSDSAEPKSATAFQRVKVDEVKFADEKLQDNSYWAKDGADVGYGAKAQEVLGQVRGKDFRHEKTKKKRGSYRGGQIDLHSHSVKFNYDDDE